MTFIQILSIFSARHFPPSTILPIYPQNGLLRRSVVSRQWLSRILFEALLLPASYFSSPFPKPSVRNSLGSARKEKMGTFPLIRVHAPIPFPFLFFRDFLPNSIGRELRERHYRLETTTRPGPARLPSLFSTSFQVPQKVFFSFHLDLYFDSAFSRRRTKKCLRCQKFKNVDLHRCDLFTPPREGPFFS